MLKKLAFLLAVAIPLFADIRGRVTLPDGAPLPGVTVTAGGTVATTDADGRYVLQVAERGPVKVTASLSGFQTRSETVNAGGDAVQDFTLRVSFGEQITVGSRAIGAEQEKAVPVDIIPQEQIQ